MIEVIIIITILMLCTLINNHLYNNNNISNYYYKERDLLLNKLIEAKQDAINNKSITYLRFNNNELIIQNNKNIKKIIFKNIQFQSSGELFFNKNGNINQGKTINMIMNYKLHKIVFYLGKGWFKIE